ncbi:unnamed protein product [Sphenostylis stenocarpa]|uniref:Uncharacterized protein n=1 Tax=Sphenostylis stenocarpa TaxID=92480 RepID=A0AA86SEJ8_9FABA|nr:unnamed protein product [Sphenostylis stenocarpa]
MDGALFKALVLPFCKMEEVMDDSWLVMEEVMNDSWLVMKEVMEACRFSEMMEKKTEM